MAVRSVARPVPNIRTAERDLSARARSWAYAEAGKRDLRLDFLRGLAVLLYTLVHALWSPLHHALGWFMIPMGQNSLYVYIAQLLVMVVLFNTTPAVLMWGRGYIDLDLLNLGSQLFGLGSLWLMVRSRFLFALIPR